MLYPRNYVSAVRVSIGPSRQRTAPSTSFGSRLTAGHQKHLIQSLGVSAPGAEELVNGAPVSSSLDRAMITSALSQDESLSNLAIQVLMSAYSQSEQLASGVLKKRDDTANASIGNIR